METVSAGEGTGVARERVVIASPPRTSQRCSMSRSCARFFLSLTFALAAHATFAQCPAVVPAANSTVPGPLPLFPADNWWNTDISQAPVDASSANFIAFINNGGTRRLHPDFGGEVSPGSVSIYGMPYAIVD